MPKQKSCTKSTLSMPQDEKEKKPSCCSSSSASAHKTSRDEIDEIFATAGKKRKNPDDKKVSQPRKNKKKDNPVIKDASKRAFRSHEPILKKKSDKSNDNMEKTNRNKTGDGFSIYTEEELGIGKTDAGGTSLCPFDCDCCF